MSALVVSLLLASASVSTADRAALDAATRAIYAPYQSDELTEVAAWDRDIWTREIRDLIVHWQSVIPLDEPDAMNDGDWLCQCQDWDSNGFRVKIKSFKAVQPGAAKVTVNINLGHGDPHDAVLSFLQEGDSWLLDDMHTEEYSEGIKAALRQTILDDEALLKARK